MKTILLALLFASAVGAGIAQASTEANITVSGIMYVDLNNDGVYSSTTEFGVYFPYVITLSGSTSLGAVYQAVLSNQTGPYNFTLVPPGSYTLTASQPANFVSGPASAGSLAGTAVGAYVIRGITIDGSANGTDYNFAQHLQAAIAGRAYIDADGGNSYGFGPPDQPVAGAVLTLSGTDDNGAHPVITTTTASDGSYSFAPVRAGQFTITVPALPNIYWTHSLSPYGSPAQSGVTSTRGISLSFGTSLNNYDFLAGLPGLQGNVFQDGNADGQFQPSSEYGIGSPAFQIQLTGVDALGAVISRSTTTNYSGFYSFALSSPGSYTLTRLTPFASGQYLDGRMQIGSLGGTAVLTNVIKNITVVSTPTLGFNYNFAAVQPGQSFGQVYEDRNGTGLYEGAWDANLQNITVTLAGVDDLGAPVLTTTLSTFYGQFTFYPVRPGSYTATVSPAPGFILGPSSLGTNGIPGIGVVTNITLTSGGTGYLGQLAQSQPGISGYIYEDLNNNGVLDPAFDYPTGTYYAPFPQVSLLGQDYLGNPVTRTTLLNGTAFYNFSNTITGTYHLSRSMPVNLSFLDSAVQVGTLNGVTTGVSSGVYISSVTYAAGQLGRNYNFAEYHNGAIYGVVFNDVNGDGQDINEPGIPGVIITITGVTDLGPTALITSTSDVNGNYNAIGLRPGLYAITETQPISYSDGTASTFVAGAVSGINAFTNITVTSGGTASPFYFGERLIGLSGVVYRDNATAAVPNTTIILTGATTAGAPVSRTALSRTNGYYFFENVLSGTYSLVEQQPLGYLDSFTPTMVGTLGGISGTNVISGIVFPDQGRGDGYNFNEYTPSSIQGYVFYDSAPDGALNSGETTLSTTVTLTGTDDLGHTVNIVTTSLAFLCSYASSNQCYTPVQPGFNFGNLRPGTYALVETQPLSYTDGPDAAPQIYNYNTGGYYSTGVPVDPDQILSITLPFAQNYAPYLFAERHDGLSGNVFRDYDNNGVISCFGYCDVGLPNLVVVLSGTSVSNYYTRTTNAAGDYSFSGVAAGNYRLSLVPGPGLLAGTAVIGTGGGSVVSRTEVSLTYTAGTLVSGYNFALLAPWSLSGYVLVDVVGNLQCCSAPGIAGVTVTLRGVDDNGAPVLSSTRSIANGTFAFGGLRAGSYTLTEQQPAGFLNGIVTAGSFGGITSTNDSISFILVGPGNLNTSGQNYLFAERPQIAGNVFQDIDNNGIINAAADYGLVNVRLTLSGTAGNPFTATTLSDGLGIFYFSGVPAGSYVLSETQPAGYLDGADFAGIGGSVLANDLLSLTVPAGQTINGLRFAELPPAALQTYAFYDLNNNGTLDCASSCEPYVAATMILSGTDDLSSSVQLTLTTIGPGAFGNLRPGIYTLTELQPEGYTDGKDTAGNIGGITTGVPDGIDSIRFITITPGSTATGYSFGERRTGLSGYVYRDLNNNGAREGGEAGIIYAVIELTGTQFNGALVDVFVSTSDLGYYSFGNLLTGTYRISEYQPIAYLDGLETVGTISGTVRGTAGADYFDVSYNAGEFGVEYNFGELPPASVLAQVYFDANNNGAYDGVDSAIPGASMLISGTDDLGHAVSATLFTDISGVARFGGLRPGTYGLIETQPTGYSDGIDCLQPGNLLCSTPPDADAFTGITLAPGQNAATYAFGERKVGLSGHVYIVSYSGGAPTGQHVAQYRVDMILSGTTYLGGNVIKTAATDINGFYSFGALITGTYQIIEASQPLLSVDGPDVPGTLGGVAGPIGTDVITVSYNAAGSAFGENYDFTELPQGILGGYVYYDIHKDGRFLWTGCDPRGPHDFLCDPRPNDLVWEPGGIETPVYVDTSLAALRNGPVTIIISGIDDLSDTVWITGATNSNGRFEFDLLRPGTYTITEVQRETDVDGLVGRINAPMAVTGTNIVRGIVLSPGLVSGAVFGEDPSLTGYTYQDDNDNGLFERVVISQCSVPENGIGNVSLRLTGIDIYNHTVDRQTSSYTPPVPTPPQTECDRGYFFFGSLVTGTYTLIETQPAGYGDGKDTIGTGGGLTTTNDIIDRIVFTPGHTITGYLFGELKNVIEGVIFTDRNGNGALDLGEGGTNTSAQIRLTGIDDLAHLVTQTVTTNYRYQFAALRPGTYTITLLGNPPGYTYEGEQLGSGTGGSVVTPGVFGGLAITPGGSAFGTGYNFAEVISASIAGAVFYRPFLDSGLGVASMSGLPLALSGASGAVLSTTVTDALGSYVFGKLSPGAYTITLLSVPLGYSDRTATVCGGPSGNGTVMSTRSIVSIPVQFGDQVQGCQFLTGPVLTGRVFADANLDGLFTPGENGIYATEVDLTGTLASGGVLSQSVTTNEFGEFAFAGLLTGSYQIREPQPSGFFEGAFTAGTLGGVTGTLAVSSGIDVISGIVYTPNLIGANYWFGELAPASIDGLAFFDANSNGTFEPPTNGLDFGIPATVTLEGVNDLGAHVLYTQSNSIPGYHFGGLRAGVYTLTEQQPAGFTDWIDCTGCTNGNVTNDRIGQIQLGWGSALYNYNFAERRAGIIGTVYADYNNNGVFEPYLFPPGRAEGGIVSVTMLLRSTTNAVFSTTQTGYGGAYQFAELPPGTYIVCKQADPPGFASGKASVGSNLGGAADPLGACISGIQIGAQLFGTDYNFGELPASTLSGRVYVDANNNGSPEQNEQGIGGVTMTLSGVTLVGAQPVLQITLTAATGAYAFTGLDLGVYAIHETQPAYANGKVTAGTVDGAPNGVAVQNDNNIIGITLNTVADGKNYNFGERNSGVTGFVYWDANLNNTRDITGTSEPGLYPVAMALHGRDNQNNPVNLTTQTGLDGAYSFDVPPGAYMVQETPPFGFISGAVNVGTVGGVTVGTVGANNVINGIVLGASGPGLNYNFAARAPSAADFATAMGIAPAWLLSGTIEGDGPTPLDAALKVGVGTTIIQQFPIEGGSYAYLGTGNMILADQPNNAPDSFGLGLHGAASLTLHVPANATCMSVDFKFFSEEFPEFRGSAFNDSFDMYLDGVPFARDALGNRISINTVFAANAANAAGSTYDGATPRLRAQVPVTPGATSVFSLTITDVGDPLHPANIDSYDSGVFLDRFRFGNPVVGGCEPGVVLPVAVSVRETVNTLPFCGTNTNITVPPGTEVTYCYAAQNTGELTLTEQSLTTTVNGDLLYFNPVTLAPGDRMTQTWSQVLENSVLDTSVWTAYSGTVSTTATSSANVNVVRFIPDPTHANLHVSPGSEVITKGVPITVDILISDVWDLGAAEFKLSFNPAVVSVTRVSDGGFIGSSGRTVQPIAADIGATSIRFAAATYGPGPGPQVLGVLARLSILPVGNGVSGLSLSEILLGSTRGLAITPASTDGQVFTLLPADTPTATPTPTPTATATRTPTPTATATPAAAQHRVLLPLILQDAAQVRAAV